MIAVVNEAADGTAAPDADWDCAESAGESQALRCVL
jgi:hypothetical protein